MLQETLIFCSIYSILDVRMAIDLSGCQPQKRKTLQTSCKKIGNPGLPTLVPN